ncbi:MAG TPA: hypothetical protein VJ385_06655 [Fibrobacteria bacterium]|nr:hypothetical protein [Fibrobacteria bacterium]
MGTIPDRGGFASWMDGRAGKTRVRRFRRAWGAPRLMLAAGLAAGLAITACKDGDTGIDPVPADDGIWILDSAYTLDEFPFRTAECAEVFPEGSANLESVPPGSVADLRIISTACYRLRVRVVDSDSDTVRTLETRFGIFNRSETEKNRGVVGFVAWDGKDDQGAAVSPGRYLWRMEFDFGSGRIRKFRTDFILPQIPSDP